MDSDIRKALRPIKKGAGFIVETSTKPVAHMTAAIVSAPVDGLNKLLVEKINNPDVYSGARVGKASQKMKNYFKGIPKKMGDSIRRL